MKQRIEWVDILKGLAIFLVVFGHVEVFSEGALGGFFFRLQNIFCMPLFFFLSGLFAKPQHDLKESIIGIKKKFIQLIIPFLVCGSLYICVIMPNKSFWALLGYPNSDSHCGYWFLLVLFEIYVLFTICQVITRKLSKNLTGKTFFIVALTLELMLSVVYVLCQIGSLSQGSWYSIVSFVKLFYHFPFFVVGFLFMSNLKLIAIMFSNRAYSISSILFVGIFIVLDKFNLHLLPFQWILAILSVIMIVSLCSTSEKMPPPIKAALKNTEYLGRHTMEIYVLHYFFLPRNMNFLRDIIIPNNRLDVNIILELIINSFIACAIIAIVLCCTFLISRNVYMKQLLFGKH